VGNIIAFWNVGSKLTEDSGIFGCSANGFSTEEKCASPNISAFSVWDPVLPGEVLKGSYNSVPESLSRLSFTPQIAIVLFNKAEGFELFLKRVSALLPATAFIGGGAAFSTKIPQGELLPDAADVCVLAVPEGNYQIETLNIYEDTKRHLVFEPASLREIARVRELPNGRWQNAISYYRSIQTELEIEPDNFEKLCFCDKNRRNLHCSIRNGNLFAGANLPENNLLSLNLISREKASDKLREFMRSSDSLIFGCAGIRSLVDEPFFTGKRSLAGFMFGEIVTCGKKAELGNLMLTKLKIV